jgi:hypothetical protein
VLGLLPWRERDKSAEKTILGEGIWLVDTEASSARLRCVIVFKKKMVSISQQKLKVVLINQLNLQAA